MTATAASTSISRRARRPQPSGDGAAPASPSPRPDPVSPGGAEGLDHVRGAIDRVDRSLVRLMARRVRLAWRAAALERAGDVAMPDPAREVGAVRRAAVVAREAGLDEEVVRCVFWHLVRLSRHARPRTGGDAEGGR